MNSIVRRALHSLQGGAMQDFGDLSASRRQLAGEVLNQDQYKNVG